jgi:hypothetical protein
VFTDDCIVFLELEGGGGEVGTNLPITVGRVALTKTGRQWHLDEILVMDGSSGDENGQTASVENERGVEAFLSGWFLTVRGRRWWSSRWLLYAGEKREKGRGMGGLAHHGMKRGGPVHAATAAERGVCRCRTCHEQGRGKRGEVLVQDADTWAGSGKWAPVGREAGSQREVGLGRKEKKTNNTFSKSNFKLIQM